MHLSTKNPINKVAMNNRRLLIPAVFHFVHPVEKSQIDTKLCSFSCQNKQVSRSCINFPHEPTCQILTYQSIKIIGRRAWWTHDRGKKKSSPSVFLDNWLNFQVGPLWHKHNIFHMNLKIYILEPAIIWKLVTCQCKLQKNTLPQWVDTWAHDTVRWYWSVDTLLWQLSIDHNIDVQSSFLLGSTTSKKVWE